MNQFNFPKPDFSVMVKYMNFLEDLQKQIEKSPITKTDIEILNNCNIVFYESESEETINENK